MTASFRSEGQFVVTPGSTLTRGESATWPLVKFASMAAAIGLCFTPTAPP